MNVLTELLKQCLLLGTTRRLKKLLTGQNLNDGYHDKLDGLDECGQLADELDIGERHEYGDHQDEGEPHEPDDELAGHVQNVAAVALLQHVGSDDARGHVVVVVEDVREDDEVAEQLDHGDEAAADAHRLDDESPRYERCLRHFKTNIQFSSCRCFISTDLFKINLFS